MMSLLHAIDGVIVVIRCSDFIVTGWHDDVIDLSVIDLSLAQ